MIWLILVWIIYVNGDTLDVNTPLGTITGVISPVTGLFTETYQFRRIPYAKPPLADLRFRKPVPYGPWNGIYDGTYFGPSCMHIPDPYSSFLMPNKTISEDCLYLNIYTPNVPDISSKKAVMVWIHGGGYATGTGMIYDASYMTAIADVIVVTINYRLGIFGFFTLDDPIALGNYGLWDQKLALQWINQNIAYFGGDKRRVTIFGESAGGFSVGLHTLIPSNRGLFQRAIAESGVGNSFLATTGRRGKDVSIKMGDLLGCNYGHGSSSELIKFMECMRNASSETITNFTSKAELAPDFAVHFGLVMAPVVDGELITDAPQKLMSNTNSDAYKFFTSIDFIVGNVNAEGSLLLLFLPFFQKAYNFDLSKGIPYTVFCDKIVAPFTEDYYEGNQKVKEAICKEYGRQDQAEQARQTVNMYTDSLFIVPAVVTLQYHAANVTNNNSYQYIFTQKSPKPYGPKRPSWYTGSGHASELVFLFGLRDLPKINITVPKEDLELSDNMIGYWTNFAKKGDPNGYKPGTAKMLPVWRPFNQSTRLCEELSANLTTISNYNADRIKFWTEDIPNIIQEH